MARKSPKVLRAGYSRNGALGRRRAYAVKHPVANAIRPKTTRGAAARVTWSQVTAFRLSGHHLLERAPARALISVVGEMAGAQAQVLSAAQISLWARVRDLRVEDVDAALRARTVVKAWCMSRTMHHLPSEDLGIFARGSARHAEREIRWVRGRGISDRVLEELIDAALRGLDQPLTGRELIERASRAFAVRTRAISAA